MTEAEAKTTELQIDDVVDGRYRICRRLGRGGMGTVYEAQQTILKRKIALKVLRPEFASKELAAKRFEREATSASSIDHRNVVNIIDFGHLESGELYYTMELLQGRDLAQVLREEGALPWSRAGWIILQVVRAFAAIHDKGIVHRDLKPANCVLLDPKPGDDPDFVKILDFGIANLQDKTQATALTGASDIIGSVPYMAPEQVDGGEVDARTDIYSLGIMMYELLTGQVPFREQHIFKVMLQHKTEAPQPPRELVPDIPPEVEAIILRSIAKRPEDRFQSMAEIELELSLFVEKPQVSAVIQRTSPSVSSADRSAMGSSAGRPMLSTRPGPTGTVAVSTSASTRPEGKAADTTPRVGGSLAFMAQTYGEPQRKSPLLAIVVVLLVFSGAIALTVWLQRSKQGDEVATKQGDETTKADSSTKPKEEDVPDEHRPIIVAPPPPEDPYDPFADPFGAPSLRGRKIPSKPGPEGADGPVEEVPLEEILQEGSWLLAPGHIAGTILDEERRPLAKARVCAWIVDPRAPAELRRRPRCIDADRRGRFELREMPPSFYDITAFAPKFAPQSLLAHNGYPLTVQPEQRSEEVEMLLARGGVEVRGTVKTSLREPLKTVSVAAVGSVRALASTNEKGEFSLWMAQGEGEVAVVAWRDGYSDVVARGQASTPFDLTMRRETVLLGQVVDKETKKPIAKARVRANPQKGGGLNPVVYTDESGGFRIGGLPDGSYLPSAYVGEERFGKLEKPVKAVEAGIMSEIVIEIPPPPPKPQPVVAAAAVVDPGEIAEAGGSTGDDATSGDTEGTGGETGGGAESGGAEEPAQGEPPVVAQQGIAASTKVPGSAVPGPVAPPTGSAKPVEPVEPTEPAKPAVTNQTIRKKAAAQLKRCGKDGTIEVTATYVLAEGRLFQPKVKVTGEAAKDPAVKTCAEKVAKGIKLLRLKANEVASFEPLEVKI